MLIANAAPAIENIGTITNDKVTHIATLMDVLISKILVLPPASNVVALGPRSEPNMAPNTSIMSSVLRPSYFPLKRRCKINSPSTINIIARGIVNNEIHFVMRIYNLESSSNLRLAIYCVAIGKNMKTVACNGRGIRLNRRLSALRAATAIGVL